MFLFPRGAWVYFLNRCSAFCGPIGALASHERPAVAVANYASFPRHATISYCDALDIRWGAEYGGDLLVAYHGSWNRSTPTGYKIVRIKLDSKGGYESTEDFMSGWLMGAKNAAGALGRPVDLRFSDDGSLYVSDDKAGVIYKITKDLK